MLFSSEMFLFLSNCSLTMYKSKNKIVYNLSSMHEEFFLDKNQKKKLSKTVDYYDKTKAGVDALNQLLMHTCKSVTKRCQLHLSLTSIIEFA